VAGDVIFLYAPFWRRKAPLVSRWQLHTLYVTPVFYLYLEQFREWLGRFRKPTEPAPLQAAGVS
jgi:hypothetical protein